jgi:hypothetical protein
MEVCDVNRDQKINVTDIDLILAARDTVTGALDPRDLDNNGYITINDANGCKLHCDYDTCVLLPRGTTSVSYTAALTTMGANAPYTFTVTSGSLPAGISLGAGTGILSGIPTVAGTFPITVGISENNSPNRIFSSDHTVIIEDPPAVPLAFVTASTLPGAMVGSAYTETLAASGGKTPYTFMRTSGSFPVGLTLSSSGVISGTPTAAGTSTFKIRVADKAGAFVTRTFTLTVVN